jgi:hypothetical protein
MNDTHVKSTSPLFNLNYVFEPRWGSSLFDNGDVLVISDLGEETRLHVNFAESRQMLLGRGSSQPTDDLDDQDEDANTDVTITTVSAEFRQQLLQLVTATEEEQERAEHLRNAPLPVIDLHPFYAHMFGVSRRHAVLEKDGRRITVTDLHSTNGTRLNGTALYPMQRRIIRNGDELQVGNLRLRVQFSKWGSDD